MKGPNVSITGTAVLALAALAGLAVVYLKRKEIGAAAVEAAQAMNPASDKNLVYRGVSSVGAAVSGNADWSLGTWVYDLMHPNEAEELGLTNIPQATYDETERLARRYPSGAYGL